MNFADVFAWSGTILLSVCSAFQVVDVVSQKHAKGLNPWFIITWMLGCFSTFVYLTLTEAPLVLELNYAVNCIFAMIITRYKFFPKD